MGWQTWAIVLILLGTGLAGCIGKGENLTPESNNGNTTTNMTAPDGRRLAAFEETNQTEASGTGSIEHNHDFWQGQTRLTIFEESVMLSPSGADLVFSPPQGRFIYEGAASVDITISEPQRHACEPLITFGRHFYCTDYIGEGRPAAPAVADPTGGPSGLKLRYQHASTTKWIDVGEFSWGVPLTIKITDPRQTDMPHATSSVWRFEIVSPNQQDVTLTFKTKAEAVRAEGEIVKWPAHPVFYTPEKPTRLVVDNVAAAACDSGFSGTGCLLGSADTEPVTPSKLLSYGTRTLYVWVNVTSFTANNPADKPNSWVLHHANATSADNITDARDVTNYGTDKTELFWILPVDDGAMDSPYADGSRWQFQLGAALLTADTPAGKGTYCYGNCAEWTAEYTITVIASSLQLPEEEYHWNCLDPAVSTCPPPK